MGVIGKFGCDKISHNFFSLRAYCFAPRCIALGCRFLSRHKKRRKKDAKGRCPLESRAASRHICSALRADFRCAKVAGAPQRFYLAKFRVFALKKREYTKAMLSPKCLRLFLSRKREIFAKQIFKPRLRATKWSDRSGLHCTAQRRGVEGRSPRSLSFAISLWNDKEMASKPTQRARAAVRARRKSC